MPSAVQLAAWTICLYVVFEVTAAQRPIIRGYTMFIGNCADMFLNKKPRTIDIQTCANQCQQYTGCRGFSFDHLEQHCWLKWGICDKIKPVRLTPVVFYKNDLWGFTAEAGSCPGQLAVPPIFTDVVDCASSCRKMANCSGFTYDFEGDICYLKTQVCQQTMPSDLLAVKSWVKYYRKDFWVPAALGSSRRMRKNILLGGDDDPARSREVLSGQPLPSGMQQNTSNPLEMVFFDNHNGMTAEESDYRMSAASLSENDPWEAYASPNEGSDYKPVSTSGKNLLTHRATIANASEAQCSRACTLDDHCAYFYLTDVSITMVITSPNISADKERKTRIIKQQNCVLFSRWNSSGTKGKMLKKVAHVSQNLKPPSEKASHEVFDNIANKFKMYDRTSDPYKPPSTAFQPHPSPITLISLKKRKRHLTEHEQQAAFGHLTNISSYWTPKLLTLLLLVLLQYFIL